MRYATPEMRFKNNKALDAEITKWTLLHEKNEAMEILMLQYGVPAGAIHNMEELIQDEFLHTTILKTIHDKELEDFVTPVDPIKMSENEVEPISAGRAGTANYKVFHDELGFSEDYLEELRNKKII